jgi:hypothetical protein
MHGGDKKLIQNLVGKLQMQKEKKNRRKQENNIEIILDGKR